MSYQNKLNNISGLAKGNKLQRLLNNPYKYIFAQYFKKLIYPKKQQAKKVRVKTFFDKEMELLLPAGMDIYILGAKTHDSEIRLSQFLLSHLKAGDCFIDIGAHFGFYSLLAATLVKENGKVISIEGSSSTFKTLQNNIKQFKNIIAQNVACTDSNKKVSYYEYPTYYSEFNSIIPNQHNNEEWIVKQQAKKIEIEGKTVDSILKELNLKPNFIKIDVEGAEDLVIAGIANTLTNNTNLCIAMEYVDDKTLVYNNATLALNAAGYNAFTISSNALLQAIEANDILEYLKKNKLDSDNIIFKR